MPAVLREGGFSFRIYSNDHDPPHVHAVLGAGVVVITLGSPDDAPEVREFHGVKSQDVRRALDIACERQGLLLEAWKRIYGERG